MDASEVGLPRLLVVRISQGPRSRAMHFVPADTKALRSELRDVKTVRQALHCFLDSPNVLIGAYSRECLGPQAPALGDGIAEIIRFSIVRQGIQQAFDALFPAWPEVAH